MHKNCTYKSNFTTFSLIFWNCLLVLLAGLSPLQVGSPDTQQEEALYNTKTLRLSNTMGAVKTSIYLSRRHLHWDVSSVATFTYIDQFNCTNRLRMWRSWDTDVNCFISIDVSINTRQRATLWTHKRRAGLCWCAQCKSINVRVLFVGSYRF